MWKKENEGERKGRHGGRERVGEGMEEVMKGKGMGIGQRGEEEV